MQFEELTEPESTGWRRIHHSGKMNGPPAPSHLRPVVASAKGTGCRLGPQDQKWYIASDYRKLRDDEVAEELRTFRRLPQEILKPFYSLHV
jgi:hypothetical protein